MGVIRVNKSKDYTVMSNYHFKDKNLSLKAKGLLSQMLSLPEDWDYSIEGLASINKEGVKAIRAGLQELEELGYLKRTRVNDSNGRFDYIYDIYEKPEPQDIQQEDSQELDLPYTQKGNTVEDLPYTQKGHTLKGHTLKGRQLNTKESNTKILNTDIKKERKNSYEDIIDSLVFDPKLKEALIEFIKMRKLIKAPLTDNALELLIKKLNKLSSDPQIQVEIVEQSIANSWRGIFPLKVDTAKASTTNAVTQKFNTTKSWYESRVKEVEKYD